MPGSSRQSGHGSWSRCLPPAVAAGSDSSPALDAAPPLSVWSSSATRLPRARASTTATPITPAIRTRWYGGVLNPEWQGDYQLCHDSAQAYGDVLAPMIRATLTKFACTGSTYDNGITFDRRYGGALYRPAQFGNWLGMTNLNTAYDAAKPDVVIITLGADDVSFADIFIFCAIGYTDAAQVAALANAPDRSRQLRADFVQRFPTMDAWRIAHRARPRRRTARRRIPAQVILNLFWDPINSGQIAGNYKNLVAAIKARGAQAGKIPRIIFTTYHQPLPGPAQSIECLDLGDLSRDEINYLITPREHAERDADRGGERVGRRVGRRHLRRRAGHEFCTSDPWTYGISVLRWNDASLAPFHPIPQGQAAIAAVLKQSFPQR